MTAVIDAENLTESPTQFAPVNISSGWLVDAIVRQGVRAGSTRKGLQSMEPDLVLQVGPSKFFILDTKVRKGDVVDSAAALKSALENIRRLQASRWYPPIHPTADSPSTTAGHVRLWRRKAKRREELLRRLTPERRATYERITRLRDDIGALDFDVVEELRNLREDG